ncbi:hypothetical protein FHU38_001580 [Saccharomonospora amisosensis]|uniref:DUF6457 domain-containing protein n=1 Tax=Saccharomonospora amisosensis TaxID=1128677 RepID=A0A7X5UNF2_9PSEU|nr:DUF6457 domain-containing protein [Saccharomonospora amisosensis]NIJ11236.1 hypothetical protein [Saccharomonospora amisosensis]
MNELREWTSALCSNLGLDASGVNRADGVSASHDSAGTADMTNIDTADRELIVDLTRCAARTVAAQAGPIAAYLVGIAVGRGLTPAEAAARLDELTLNWPRIDWRD